MNQKSINCDILIIGAGLTGLALARLLHTSNISYSIVEARNRIGGRIHTEFIGPNSPVEMGATWLGNKHKNLVDLINELDIDVFDQVIGDTAIYEAISTSPHFLANLPPNPEPSLRIKGGSMQIINAIYTGIDVTKVYLESPVTSIEKADTSVNTNTDQYKFTSKIVVSTLPPNLFANTIRISPALPESIINIATNTHTWMGESIKIALTFEKPFWRANHLSGTIISNVGPIPEMYDHSNHEDNFYAIKGFLNGGYFQLSKEQRLNIILTQLRKYYGKEVEDYTSYQEKAWRNETYTFHTYNDNILPHQNNGNPVFGHPVHNNSLIIAGSETSPIHPGYMEGAVVSAKQTHEKILSILNR